MYSYCYYYSFTEIMIDYSQSLCRNSPRSCLEIAKTQKLPLSNRYYWIYDRATCNQAYPHYFVIYCDFTSQQGYAWTLIQSFSRDKNTDSQIHKAFINDRSVNSDNPHHHWSYYRMTRSQMLSVYNGDQSVSRRPLWRATCNFLSLSRPFPSSPRDVIYSSFSSFNILNSTSTPFCTIIDYVNIRGYRRRSGSYSIEYDPFRLHVEGSAGAFYCNYQLPTSTPNAHYFGSYGIASYDVEFSCTRSSSSTTNFWFGALIS